MAPSGGQRGTTVEVTISGINVGRGTGLVFEGSGLTVDAVTPEKPPPPAAPKAGEKPPEPPKNPPGKLTARLRIAPDAAPGIRAMRVLTPLGPSDVAWFVVGQWPEVGEREPNNSREQAQPVSFPVTINGRVDPVEDLDCFRFHALAGRTLVFDVLSARLDTSLDSILSLQDARGHEVALNEDFNGLDSLLTFTVPADGEYTLVLRDVRNQGGGDYPYRLSMGELPYVTGVFPAGGRPGETVAMTLNGFNLGASTTLRVSLAGDTPPGPLPMTLSLPTGTSNPITVAVGDATEVMEVEPNDDPAKAHRVTVPITVNGRIDGSAAAGVDVDCYRFRAQKGQSFILEVMARRLGSELDSQLVVTDAHGKELASNDDGVGKDSLLEFTAPETGEYGLRISDLQERQGPGYTYRLTIRPATPDFRLMFTPDRLAVGQGGRVPLTVTAEREHGFDGEIALEVTGLPQGASVLGPARIRAGQKEAILVLTAPAETALAATRFSLSGAAMIDGKAVRHAAQGMEEVVRNNEKTQRPVNLLTAAVAEPPDMVVTATPDHVVLAPGKSVEIAVKVERKKGFTGKVPLTVLGVPDGVTVDAPDLAEDKTEGKITLKADENAAPGERDLIVAGRSVIDDQRQVLHAAPILILTVMPGKKVGEK